MDVIIADLSDAVAARRELQRQLRTGALSIAEYETAFRTIDAAYATRPLCENGDGRLATALLNGKKLCSTCWIVERGVRA